jgi:predicted enzyme related to lactoylglutathione lyase
MSIRTEPWPDGVPSWTDLMAPDVPAAQAFYSAVLGWTYQPPNEEFGGYVIAEAGGAPAAGIGPIQPGARTAWTLYLASGDADKTAAAIAENGGTVLLAPGDVGEAGRMLIAVDPTGAAFGVWQAGQMIGASVVNEAGGITWEDLRSTDPAAARAFYSSVFGVHFAPVPMAPEDYQTFAPAGQEGPVGGMGGFMGEGSDSHWLVYFGVADTEAAVAAVGPAGGSVVMGVTDTPFGKMAGITDPAGALFWIVETTGEAYS